MDKKRIFSLEIPKRSHECFRGQEPLLPGMYYYSLLGQSDDGGEYRRQDFCVQCWENAVSQQNLKDLVYWKSKVIEKKEGVKLTTNRDEKAFELLRVALVQDSSEARHEAFVLALFLTRQKKMALRKEIEQNNLKYQIYEVLATEEMFYIPKIEISQLQVQEIQNQLAGKLKGP